MSLQVTPDDTDADVTEAARHLSAELAKTHEAGRRAELRVELDALLDAWNVRTRVAR